MEKIYIRLQSLEESPELHQYTQCTDHTNYQSTAPIKLGLLQQVADGHVDKQETEMQSATESPVLLLTYSRSVASSLNARSGF